MRRAVDELEQATAMVTHDATAASFADRLLFLRDGQIVRDEGPKTVDQIFELFKETQ